MKFDDYEKQTSRTYGGSTPGPEPEASWWDVGGAAVDQTQAQMYSLGAELFGSQALDDRRVANKAAAEGTRAWAGRQLGIPQTWEDVDVGENMGKYVAGQLINTAPQIAAVTAASMIPGVGAVAGPAMGYGLFAGETLEQQREASGTTDLGSALTTSIPGAAIDYFTGGQGRILRSLGREGVEAAGSAASKQMMSHVGGAVADSGQNILTRAAKYVDEMPGITGALTRTGLDVGQTMAGEAAGETAQTALQQIAQTYVDPSATMFGEDALAAYKESAIAGGLVGGVIGGAAHPFGQGRPANRSSIDQRGSIDALNPTAPVAQPAGLTPDMLGQPPGLAPTAPATTAGATAPEILTPPGAAPAAAPEAPPETKLEAASRKADELKKQVNAAREEAKTHGITGDKGAALFGQLKKLIDDGSVGEDEAVVMLTHLKDKKNGVVEKFLAERQGENDLETAMVRGGTQPAAGATKKATQAPTPGSAAAAAQKALAAAAPAAPATAAPAAPAPAPVAEKPLTPAQKLKAENDAREAAQKAAADKAAAEKKAKAEKLAAMTEGGKVKGVELEGKTHGQQAEEILKNITGKTPNEAQRRRLYAALGLDSQGNFTGKQALTWEEVAAVEAEETGSEPVSKQSISEDLAKIGVNKDVIDNIVGAWHTRQKGMGDVRKAAAVEPEEGEVGERAGGVPEDEDVAEPEFVETVETEVERGEGEDPELDIKVEGVTGELKLAPKEVGGETGMSVKTSATATAGEGRDRFGEGLKMLQQAQRMRGLSKEQRDSLKRLVKKAVTISETGLRSDVKAANLRAAIKAERVIADVARGEGEKTDTDKFMELLDKHLMPARTAAAQERKAAAVAEAKAGEGVDAELAEQNKKLLEEIAAQKEKDAAEAAQEAALRQQWEDQKMMSEEGREELLMARLPVLQRSYSLIGKAEESFNEDLEADEPHFEDLDPDLQAQWINAYYMRNTMAGGQPLMKAGAFAEAHETVREAAARKGIKRNQYGQDTTTPGRVPGEGLPAAGVPAEEAGGLGQAVAPELVAVQGAEVGNAPAGLQENAGRNAAGPAPANQENQGGAANEPSRGYVTENPFPESAIQQPVYHATRADFDVADMRGNDIGMHFGSMYQASDRGGMAPENYIFGQRTTATPAGEVQQKLGEVLEPTGGETTVAASQLGKRRMIKTFIDLRNPLRMQEPEGGAWHNPAALRDALARAGVVLPESLNKFITGFTQSVGHIPVQRDQMLDGQKIILDKIQGHLKSLGYDGVVYPNKFEGKAFARLFGEKQRGENIVGQDSYIVFDADQISMPAYDVLYNINQNRMTTAPSVGNATVTGRQRKPSLTRAVRRGAKLLDEGVITADQFAVQATAALDAADNSDLNKDIPARQRGHLILREKLLAAQRREELTPEMVEFADWMLRQNPQWATDLGISMKDPETKGIPKGASGFYEPMRRILTLVKGSLSHDTAVHEVLHHLERMMPVPMQNAIRREWAKRLARAYKKAQKGDNADLKAYYQHLMDYHFGNGRSTSLKAAEKLLKDGKVGYDAYQHFNPSEFWAVNGTEIMQGRYDVSESMLGKIRQWLAEVVERIKGAFGLRSNAAIVNALNSLARSDGQYQTGMMLSDQLGVHFMYAGQKAIDQEKQAQYKVFAEMHAAGKTAKETRKATGWWMGNDGVPRFEFADDNARWAVQPTKALAYDRNASEDARKAATYRLGDIITHSELFDRYPGAANISVQFTDESHSSINGSYGRNIISINRAGKKHQGDQGAYAMLGTVMHEVQHWVQEKEGFSPGGNAQAVVHNVPDEVFEEHRDTAMLWLADQAMKMEARADSYDTVMADPRTQQLFDLEDRVKTLWGYDWSTPEFKTRLELGKQARELANAITENLPDNTDMGSVGMALRHMLSGPEGFKNRFKGVRKEAADLKAQAKLMRDGTRAEAKQGMLRYWRSTGADYDLYRALHGETEARDTEERMGLEPEERERRTPLVSEIKKTLKGTLQESVYLPVNLETGKYLSEDSEPGFQNIERITQGFPPAAKTTAVAAHDLMVSMGKGNVAPWLQAMRFTRDLLNSAKKGLPSAVRYGQAMDRIAALRLEQQRKVARIVDDAKKLPADVRKAANNYMRDSTFYKKWGFQPDWLKDEKGKPIIVQQDHEYVQRFNALDPDARAVVMEAFRHSHNELMQMQEAVQAKANTAYGTSEKDQEAKQEFLDRFSKLMESYRGNPYLPLKRFGDWVVVAKSPEYRTAEAAYETMVKAKPAKTDKEGRKKLKEARNALQVLETNDAHYRVSFRETRGEAAELQRQWSNDFDGVDVRNRDSGYTEAFGTGVQTLGLLSRIRGVADDADISKESHKTMAKLLTDFELSMLSELSVRQSERHRKGIHGADDDMFRSFGTKGMSTANFIASMRAGGDAEAALQAMKEEANEFGVQRGVDSEQRTMHFNEISKRHYMGFDYRPSPFVEKALRVSSIFQLMLNPAYHLVNMLQPLTMSAPWLAGKHGGWRTYDTFRKAYMQLLPEIRNIAKSIEASDYSKLPEDVQGVVKALVDRGAISADMIYEHGRIKWKTDDPTNPAAKVITKTNEIMDDVGSTVEFTNRVVTAMAAYRLAVADGVPDPTESAYRAIYETHGDYSGFNAPRVMRHPAMRMLTQYRKFQLIQLGLWGRLMRDSFAKVGPELSAVERGIARRQLAHSLGMMFSVGGTLALPGAERITEVLNAIFGDEDDPDDFETKARKLIGDKAVADLLLTGLPSMFGVNVSEKLGAGRMLTALPYTEFPTDRESYAKVLTAALGPFVGGLGSKMVDGMGQIWQGNYWKGIENLMPNGFANMMKAARFTFGEGITSKSGDVQMSSDDIGLFTGISQAVGLPSKTITDRSKLSEAKYRADEFFKERVTRVKREYTAAVRSGDTQAAAEARQRWVELQAVRKERGYKPSPMSELLKAPQERAKREKSAVGGVVPAGKREAGALQQLQEELTE